MVFKTRDGKKSARSEGGQEEKITQRIQDREEGV